jgi:hypothetical protein
MFSRKGLRNVGPARVPSPATVIAMVALFVAIGGGTCAAAASARPRHHPLPVRATPPLVLHPRFRQVARGVSSFASDGRHVLVASASGTFLIDDQTGGRTMLTPPALCGYTYFVGGGWVLASCAGYGNPPYQLYSIATRTWTAVNSSGGMPVAIGADWIEYYGPTDPTCVAHCLYQYSFGDITTGQVQTLPGWVPGGTTIPDLNSPGLTGRLCRSLRVPQGFPQGETSIADAPDPLTFAGRYAAGTEWYMQRGLWQLRLRLERCGSRLHRVITTQISTPDGVPQFAINRHAVVWLSSKGGSVHGLFLPSLRKFTIASARPLSVADLIILTPRTLYLEVGLDVGRGLVIAAPSPRTRTPRRHHVR